MLHVHPQEYIFFVGPGDPDPLDRVIMLIAFYDISRINKHVEFSLFIYVYIRYMVQGQKLKKRIIVKLLMLL